MYVCDQTEMPQMSKMFLWAVWQQSAGCLIINPLHLKLPKDTHSIGLDYHF